MRYRGRAHLQEEVSTMADKGKGNKTGKDKKTKASKPGNRPHEQRARETVQKTSA